MNLNEFRERVLFNMERVETRPSRLLGPGRPYLRNGICYGCGVVLDLCTGVEVTVTNVKGHPFYEVGDVLRIHRGIA